MNATLFTRRATECALALIFSVVIAGARTRTIAARLGYPPDARLVILHADVMAATPQLYAVLVKVAHEYKLPFLAVRTNDPVQAKK